MTELATQTQVRKLPILILAFLAIASLGFSQTEHDEKVSLVIEKLELNEFIKHSTSNRFESIKAQVKGADSIRLVELESQLTEQEVMRRIGNVMDSIFTNEEIDQIYDFIQTSAYNKLFNSDLIIGKIADAFLDIEQELDEISDNIDKEQNSSRDFFDPIPVDRKDGFYEVLGEYNPESEDISLSETPEITPKEIVKVTKVIGVHGDVEILIALTPEGSKKFAQFTAENLGKQIAIVIGEKIVFMPRVVSAITGGKIRISGNFSEEEIDAMILQLKGE